MEIQHPGAEPLSSAQQELLASFRQDLDRRGCEGGLTPEEVRRLVQELRAHPEISVALVTALMEEVHSRFPGHQLLSFDWT
ncbi:MAG: hypothetical protein VKK62_03725 [Synechococcaceae cyanobacterium]|nr:hypothetical protein [Synechococcaceae cyanobacterium]